MSQQEPLPKMLPPESSRELSATRPRTSTSGRLSAEEWRMLFKVLEQTKGSHGDLLPQPN